MELISLSEVRIIWRGFWMRLPVRFDFFAFLLSSFFRSTLLMSFMIARLTYVGNCIKIIADHSHFVQGVAWDPLNEFIATQSSDR